MAGMTLNVKLLDLPLVQDLTACFEEMDGVEPDALRWTAEQLIIESRVELGAERIKAANRAGAFLMRVLRFAEKYPDAAYGPEEGT